MPAHKPLAVKKLRNVYDPEKLGFESTEQISDQKHTIIGQERAVKALRFGIGMPGHDYNIYVAGPREAGMGYLTRTLVVEQAKKQPAPSDWVYVHNFKDPDQPRALKLEKGAAQGFAKSVSELIEMIKNEIPEIFESEDYSQRRDELIKKFHAERSSVLSELEEKVKAEGFILNVSQVGMVIMPARDDKPMDEADLAELDDEAKENLRTRSNELQTEMNQSVRRIKNLEKDLKNQMKDLDKRVALYAVGHLIDDLQEKYNNNKAVLTYLKEVKDDVILNIDDFKSKSSHSQGPLPMPPQEVNLTRYEVNVLVDNSEAVGAPVVFEPNPSYTNLFGSMERRAQYGALFTDFTMIRPGALHRANGGYLLIKAIDLLKWWISYEGLKRSLKEREIRLEDPAEMLGFITTKGMKPEAIPLDVKVIIMGDPMYYHLLYAHDEAFAKLFKVKAHLSDQTDRLSKHVREFTRFLCRVVEDNKLPHIHKSGVSQLIDNASRLADSQDKLTLQLGEVSDLLREAGHWAREDKAELIEAKHVDRAVDEKRLRCNLYEERIQEVMEKDIIHVPTKGVEVGQVNGLSVYSLGDYSFGRPSRITANVSIGKSGAVSIDRESKMSGSIHTKGVLVLEGYLRGKYAQDAPLTLTASLCFEQSYGMVDGDSASGAELYAIISALTGLPIRQGVACTGAISQKGELQAIGGVNQKIEGQFALCNSRKLTGEQGVIIPKANVRNLMLRQEVIEAVEAGKFNIWAVDKVDHAMEILMDVTAGTIRKDGTYPPKSIHGLAAARLAEMAKKGKDAGNGKPKTEAPAPACETCGK